MLPTPSTDVPGRASEDVSAGTRRPRELGPQHSQEQDPPFKVAKEGDAVGKEDKDMNQRMKQMMGTKDTGLADGGYSGGGMGGAATDW